MNKENLLKLAKFLDELPEDYKHFNMHSWATSEKVDVDPDQLLDTNIYKCGYVACAVGHAPQALGLMVEDLRDFYVWSDFVEEYLCSDWKTAEWLFGAFWEKVDNTPKGVAKRIRYVIKNGPAIPLLVFERKGVPEELLKQTVHLYEEY